MTNGSRDDGPTACDPPHPAWLEEAELLAVCTMQQTRRGGPGGQHRNKVSTTIVLVHQPTGISAEASERRSQADNRRVALRRLRETLALRLRTRGVPSSAPESAPVRLRAKYGGAQFRVAEDNVDRPAVLALLLDDLARAAARPAEVAALWQTTTSQIVRFLREIPAAFATVNRWREDMGQKPLQ
ncbi:peptide chain release factor family protein [Candidatus Laterigemmans baculatus]|uniref:peptide chain release factor family protein n=1 Tax=Candidatus Laterigemmans baculatus TaxID=2770505 RepID=UPI0013D95859|nr:peptide chain release factor-like protein [Candidatus Laterigemmans baculatus]